MNSFPKKIYIFTKDTRGGASTLINQLKTLKSPRIQMTFCFYKKHNFKKTELNHILINQQYPESTVPSMNKLFLFFHNVFTTQNIIRENKPSLIFTIDLYSLFLHLILRVFRKGYSPICILVNNHIDKQIAEKPFYLYRALLYSLLTFLLSQADYIICVSRGLSNYIQTKYQISPKKIQSIPNGIDIKLVQQASEEKMGTKTHQRIAHNAKLLISYGRFEKQKDFITIIDSLHTLVHKNFNIHLLLVGTGTEKETIQKYIDYKHVEKQVTIIPWKDNIYPYLKLSDLFIFSSHYEGFGRSILDAMACGIPIISTKTEFGPEEILTHNKTGVLIPVCDSKKMTDSIIELIEKNNFRKKLASNAKKEVKKYDYTTSLKMYEELFLKLCR